MAIDKDMLDQLPAGCNPQDLFTKDGLLGEWKEALCEWMLSAEFGDHLKMKAPKSRKATITPAIGGGASLTALPRAYRSLRNPAFFYPMGLPSGSSAAC